MCKIKEDKINIEKCKEYIKNKMKNIKNNILKIKGVKK